MEECEQRRERLKAIRLKAAEGAETHNAVASYSLGNPLVEADRPEPSIAPRFDFYTDPMSAFSGRTKVSHQTPQPPRPMIPHIAPGSNQTPGPFGRSMEPPSRPPQGYMNGAPGAYAPPGSYQTPSHFGRPMGPPSMPPQGYMNDAPPGSYQLPGPYGRPMGPPSRPPQGYMNNAPGTYIPPGPYQTPGPFGRPMGPPQQGYMNDAPPSNSYQGGNFRGHGFVQRGSSHPNYGPRAAPYHNSGRGRGVWHGGNGSQNGSGYHQSGRGRGRGHWRGNNSQGQGRGGRGHHDEASSKSYYHESMLEDPWKDLEPTLWRGLSSTNWLPESISSTSKKARVSEKPIKVKHAAEYCLAEDLAESVHAAKASEVHDESAEESLAEDLTESVHAANAIEVHDDSAAEESLAEDLAESVHAANDSEAHDAEERIAEDMAESVHAAKASEAHDYSAEETLQTKQDV